MSQLHILERFQAEVLSVGSDAALPSNLNDFWLDHISLSLDRLFESLAEVESSDENNHMSLPLAAIVHILLAKNDGVFMEVPLDDMFVHFEDYRIEIALEMVRRRSGVAPSPATIESIFTNRDICITGNADAL